MKFSSQSFEDEQARINVAKSIFDQAVNRYRKRRFKSAIIFFERVRQISGLKKESYPKMLFNIGVSNVKLKRYATAIIYFEKYLEDGGEDKEGSQKNLTFLREKLRIPDSFKEDFLGQGLFENQTSRTTTIPENGPCTDYLNENDLSGYVKCELNQKLPRWGSSSEGNDLIIGRYQRLTNKFRNLDYKPSKDLLTVLENSNSALGRRFNERLSTNGRIKLLNILRGKPEPPSEPEPPSGPVVDPNQERDARKRLLYQLKGEDLGAINDVNMWVRLELNREIIESEFFRINKAIKNVNIAILKGKNFLEQHFPGTELQRNWSELKKVPPLRSRNVSKSNTDQIGQPMRKINWVLRESRKYL